MIVEPVKQVSKPWGSELWVAVTDQYALKIITLNAGERSSLQLHRKKHEHTYVDAGRVRAEFVGPEGEVVTEICPPGTIIENKPGELHRIEALDDVRLIEVQTPHLDDVVWVEDDYGRGEQQ